MQSTEKTHKKEINWKNSLVLDEQECGNTKIGTHNGRIMEHEWDIIPNKAYDRLNKIEHEDTAETWLVDGSQESKENRVWNIKVAQYYRWLPLQDKLQKGERVWRFSPQFSENTSTQIII